MKTDCPKLNSQLDRNSNFNDLIKAQRAECMNCHEYCGSRELIQAKLRMLDFIVDTDVQLALSKAEEKTTS